LGCEPEGNAKQALCRSGRLHKRLIANAPDRVRPRPGSRVAYHSAMKKILAFIGLLGVLYALAVQHGVFDRTGGPGASAFADASHASGACNDDTLATAYRNHRSRVEVCSHGVIERVLKDDLQGSRHQRFIVRLPPGQTVLIAYNIDIAPRIDGLRAGSPIEFAGEYEWNVQGGVVHWTHHDPGGRHPAGWIRYGGRLYQ
jgi:Protein of unknown function (DUF3465)